MSEQLIKGLKSLLPDVDFWSLRVVESEQQEVMVRQGNLEPMNVQQRNGFHLTLVKGDGIGYAASCDFSQEGVRHAIAQALDKLAMSARFPLLQGQQYPQPTQSGRWQCVVDRAWQAVALQDNIDLLQSICEHLHAHDMIVDWWAALGYQQSSVVLYTEDVQIEQQFSSLAPAMSALANNGQESQQRTFGFSHYRQSGMEHLDAIAFAEQAGRVAEEAMQLLVAPNCPAGTCDLLLMPSQMTLQIHESIGHPLELDRILGDERNYAGTSFVTEAMFGEYQYGSELLNIVFEPDDVSQIASYGFDDEGSVAQREYLIKDGILLRPLAGASSQNRSKLLGVATSLACDWNRPAIDRMANINLPAGDTSLEQMIANTENGILMDTNSSWSIDDSRNKFQFGCEYAQLIESGELTTVVKNPNYRGISAEFWRNLTAVGDQASYQVLGVGACGKGEPNQAVKVGHASPPCLFAEVDVFGAESA